MIISQGKLTAAHLAPHNSKWIGTDHRCNKVAWFMSIKKSYKHIVKIAESHKP